MLNGIISDLFQFAIAGKPKKRTLLLNIKRCFVLLWLQNNPESFADVILMDHLYFNNSNVQFTNCRNSNR